MTTLVQLPTRRRSQGAQQQAPRGTAEILLFTGIRYERSAEPPSRDQMRPEAEPAERTVRPS